MCSCTSYEVSGLTGEGLVTGECGELCDECRELDERELQAPEDPRCFCGATMKIVFPGASWYCPSCRAQGYFVTRETRSAPCCWHGIEYDDNGNVLPGWDVPKTPGYDDRGTL